MSSQWNGSRWWKMDFHTHTPASNDYGKGAVDSGALKKRLPKEWLLDYMRAQVDCVAVTDHNSGTWIDALKNALEELEIERPSGFRPMYLFPAVEMSVSAAGHVLAVLDCTRDSSDIDSLLGAVGFRGTKGKSDDVTSKSLVDVAAAIDSCGGIAIPAHADCDNGLFKLQGTSLKQALDCREIFAVEIIDPACKRPQLYTSSKMRWTEVLGSDAHHPTGTGGQQYPGSHFTWVKMAKPSLDGLRLALLDGPLSIRRSDQNSDDPNLHADQVLESIRVGKARYMGRPAPFEVRFNPWLNAVVGGRGTGKSTTVELLRMALRREGELPEELREEFAKYAKPYDDRADDGLLTSDSEIEVVYRKGGSRFRVLWNSSDTKLDMQEDIEGDWCHAEGDISQRLPIRLYSQKQVFQLAKTPLALLRVVDDSPGVDRRSWQEKWKVEEAKFLSLRAKARELTAGLSEESRLKGELQDLTRKRAVFEQQGHAAILTSFQRVSRQGEMVTVWEQEWSETGQELRALAQQVVPGEFGPEILDPELNEDASLLEAVNDTRAQLATLTSSIQQLARQADEIKNAWANRKSGSLWEKQRNAAITAYDSLVAKLREEGVEDPDGYKQVVERREAVERLLRGIHLRRGEIESVNQEARESLQRLRTLRRELTQLRTVFLAGVLQGNNYVWIKTVPYGAREAVEREFRRLLHRDNGFDKDIGGSGDDGLISQIYSRGEGQEEVEAGIEQLKKTVREIYDGTYPANQLKDQRFAGHVTGLQPEVLDRLDAWFPEDTLNVQYSPTGDGRQLRSIREGSPGQKTAALLAFLLSYGDEPLILDQPEDDLDNELIFDLIVQQLREVKLKRQVIVVTHNPNIVVNGDAELVIALTARAGQTYKDCEGSLQESSVREVICRVMEGGRAAFDQRYRRIALGGRAL